MQAVLQACSRWQRDLVDTSGRNRLRRFRDLRTSTLDLTPSRAEGLERRALDRLLSGRSVNLSDLFPDASNSQDDVPAFNDARRRLSSIHKTSLTNSEEKGIETLFLAIGLATWKVESGTPPNAPMVLVPLHVEATGAAGRDFRLEVMGDAHLNPVLTHILRAEHDINTDDAEADVEEDPPTTLKDFSALLDRLLEAWDVLPELEVEHRAVAAIFSYSTMPLVSDLEQNGSLFAENDLVAAIAGDRQARQALASRISDPEPNRPDIDPPSEEFLVLDADSSQHIAINRVLGGESLVIQGPPGTGKSQTIANLITALIAGGKRVLFVAEKRAAIEAVTKRLDQVGLSELVMDMHGGVTSRRDFARTLDESLSHIATIPVQDHSALQGRLQERRDALNGNDAALHEIRLPWRLSVYEMRERLLRTPEAARTELRLTSEAARALDARDFERLSGRFDEWVSLEGHHLRRDHPEWARSSVRTANESRRAFELAGELAHNLLPRARDALFNLLDEVSLNSPQRVSEWDYVVRFLSVASGSWWTRKKAQMFSGEYRKTRDILGAPGSVSVDQDRLSDVDERVSTLVTGLRELSGLIGIEGLEMSRHDELLNALERMASSRTTAANLPRIHELEANLDHAGIGSLVERVGGDISPELIAPTVEHAWLWRGPGRSRVRRQEDRFLRCPRALPVSR